MVIIRSTVACAALFFSLSALSAPKLEVIEHCSHDIIKLVKANKLPLEAMSMLHMVKIKDAADGYDVIAVLDHNEDHTNPPAHIKFKYDLNAKIVSFNYMQGYVNPNASVFNKLSAAKLYDIAAEYLVDSSDQNLQQYAENVTMVHLSFDPVKNAAVFEMVDSNQKEFKLWLDLSGNYMDSQFVN
jgi:hypothetical protein